MTDHARLRRLNALLEEALALPAAERAAWLAAREAEAEAVASSPVHEGAAPGASAPDAALWPELRRLLARVAPEVDAQADAPADAPAVDSPAGTEPHAASNDPAHADPFMRRPAAAALDLLAAAQARADAPGDLIGPYRLLQALGHGGMATVWLAERADGQVARQVALKLPHDAGMHGTRGLAQRLARERDLLAALEHPNIARLYDAGVTPQGRPWLAMERVEGEPIDVHCRRQGLGVRAILALALQVCAALAHAHARLIVHRDLKPANILVTPGGEVRLLDFGIGKLLHDDTAPGPGPAAAAPLTQALGHALTPDYASPEQVARRPVTVATDVYSLGVVLFELLTGERPYRLARHSAAALEEAILAADVHRASTRAPDRARARALRGDLDAVLGKALARHPSRRYSSIEALAGDLHAHLEGLPVMAQPASWRYRGAKWLARHRAGVLMGALVLASLVAGLVGTLTQARRAGQQAAAAARERDVAVEELRYAESAEELMRLVLSQGGAKPFTTRELLQQAARHVDERFAEEPELHARLLMLVAELHRELGAYGAGEPLQRRARESAARAGRPALVGETDCLLAGLVGDQGRLEEAQRLIAAALQLLGSADAAGSAGQAAHERARLACHVEASANARLRGDAAGAMREALGATAVAELPAHRQSVRASFAYARLADAWVLAGDLPRAIETYERALDTLRASGRGRTSAASDLEGNRAALLALAGQPLKAVQALEQLIKRQGSFDDPQNLAAPANHARLLTRLGRTDESRPLLRRLVQRFEAAGSPSGAAYARAGLAVAECQAAPRAACDRAMAEARQALAAVVPPGHSAFGTLWVFSGQAALQAGDAAAARAQAEQARTILGAARDRGTFVSPALALLARAEQALGDTAAARAHAEEAVRLARAEARGFEVHEYLGHALLALGRVLAQQGDRAGAREALAAAVAQLEGSLGADAPHAKEARGLLRGLEGTR